MPPKLWYRKGARLALPFDPRPNGGLVEALVKKSFAFNMLLRQNSNSEP